MHRRTSNDGGPSASILVVDDDLAIREVLGEILHDEGYTVATAANGAEALQILKHQRPELILLDLNMPVMSGADFRLVQRLDPLLRSIPTVVLSAAGRIRERTIDFEADSCLPKPVRLTDLLATVERFCGSPRRPTPSEPES